MSLLRVKTGQDKGRTFEIGPDVIKLGRDPSGTVPINDQGVSRDHAEVFRIGEMCFLRDLGSTNGTFVNDIRIGEELLRPGDQIRIGLTVLVFEDAMAEAATVHHVEFDGKEDAPPESDTTIELRLDRRAEKKGKVPAPAAAQHLDSQHLATVYEVSRIIGSEKTIDPLLTKVTEIVVEATHADNGYVFMLEKGTNRLVPKAIVEKIRGGAKVSRTIVKRVLSVNRALLTSDAGSDERFDAAASIVTKSIKSVICAPLMSMDQAIGVLYLHSSNPVQPFTPALLEMAAASAIQLGTAVTSFTSAERARRTFSNVVKSMVVAMEMADPVRKGHSERVANYAVAIAQQMGLSTGEVQRLYLAASLHDIGRIGSREGTHAAQEPARQRAEHVHLGEKLLQSLEGFEDLLPAIKFHHEKLDGTGYPAGAKGTDIPLMGRVIAVANEFDNLSAFGGADGMGMSVKDALLSIGNRGGIEYDDKVVEALLLTNKNGTLFSSGILPTVK